MTNLSNFYSIELFQEIQEAPETLINFEEALDNHSAKSIKSISYMSGTKGEKQIFYTEAIIEIAEGLLILGTTYGRKDKVDKLHPVASHYKLNDKVTDELKPVQRKGIAPASKMISVLYNLDEKELSEIITKSRDLSQYN